jgi:hypothetical protein
MSFCIPDVNALWHTQRKFDKIPDLINEDVKNVYLVGLIIKK